MTKTHYYFSFNFDSSKLPRRCFYTPHTQKNRTDVCIGCPKHLLCMKKHLPGTPEYLQCPQKRSTQLPLPPSCGKKIVVHGKKNCTEYQIYLYFASCTKKFVMLTKQMLLAAFNILSQALSFTLLTLKDCLNCKNGD